MNGTLKDQMRLVIDIYCELQKKKKRDMIFQYEVVMCYKHVFILKKTKNGNYLT